MRKAWRAAFVVWVASCGARTALPVDHSPEAGVDAGSDVSHEPPPDVVEEPEAAAEFCATAEYNTGAKNLAIHLLLDKSDSMQDDSKWDQATAAVGAFADEPEAVGLGLGLQYFPLGSECSADAYALPAVPILPLPGNALAIKESLALQEPAGETPTLPVLSAGIQYSRAFMLANPSWSAVIALVTDGDPNACGSLIDRVAEAARQGVQGRPQVLTFVIGLAVSNLGNLALLASAGGTGQPLIIDDVSSAGQQIVEALRTLRNVQQNCVFSLPPVPGIQPRAADINVTVKLTPEEVPSVLNQVANEDACSGASYFLDDPSTPSQVELCPDTCALLHANADSTATVIAGCAGTLPDGGLDADLPEAGICEGSVGFSCVPFCGSPQLSLPVCSNNTWVCPPGQVRTDFCGSCPDVPHGCCRSDNTQASAACIKGEWVCPPGSTQFGKPGCRPPDVCAPTLPCAIGQVCTYPDEKCGDQLLGKCELAPVSCPGPARPVCACNDRVRTSACEALASGSDIGTTSVCSDPTGYFRCGAQYCRLDSEYCEHRQDFSQSIVDSFSCRSLPAACNMLCSCIPQCSCPAGKTCNRSCAGSVLTCTVL